MVNKPSTPGGFRLSEAGIDIRGDRGQVLRVNYRNSEPVLEAALAVVADDAFEDIDEARVPGSRDVDLTFHDGQVLRSGHPSLTAHDEELTRRLRGQSSEALAASAVLCPSKKATEHYHRLLLRAGVAVCPLGHYDGTPTEAVKLGTYRRAKGLEFKHVYLPQCAEDAAARHDAGVALSSRAQEHRELARTQLFVAMTRARDTLWLGHIEEA